MKKKKNIMCFLIIIVKELMDVIALWIVMNEKEPRSSNFHSGDFLIYNKLI
jgi:hypothetical protein